MIDTTKGTLELIVGDGQKGDGPDGPALQCRLNRPHGVFIDHDGSMMDRSDSEIPTRVRRVELTKKLTERK